MKKLTPAESRMKHFAQLYCAGGMQNGKKAAIDAGYSARSAEATASRLLRTDKVQGYISEIKEKATKKLEIKQDEILAEIRAVAFSNVADILELCEQGERLIIKDLTKLPREVQVCVESIKVKMERVYYQGDVKVKSHVLEVKFRDKMKALDMLARWAELYKQVSPDELAEFFAGLQIIMPGEPVNAFSIPVPGPKKGHKKQIN